MVDFFSGFDRFRNHYLFCSVSSHFWREKPVISVLDSSLKILNSSTLRAFWIGHSSVYVEIDGIRILIDPVFSDYASPFDFGPKRFHPPPITLQDLPKIDAVVISHDH